MVAQTLASSTPAIMEQFFFKPSTAEGAFDGFTPRVCETLWRFLSGLKFVFISVHSWFLIPGRPFPQFKTFVLSEAEGSKLRILNYFLPIRVFRAFRG
jgi:hypothetical protein